MDSDYDSPDMVDAFELLLDMLNKRLRPGEGATEPAEIATAHLARLLRQMEQENRELRLRVAALTRLLIKRGVFNADDFAAEVADLKAIVANSPSSMASANNVG